MPDWELREQVGGDWDVKTSDIVFDLQAGMLKGRSFEEARLVVTDKVLAVGQPRCCLENFDDFVPFTEVQMVAKMELDPGLWKQCLGLSRGVMEIQTIAGGVNCGRRYCFQIEGSDSELEQLVKVLTQIAARQRKQAIMKHSFFWRSRMLVRSIFTSFPFQATVALLIVINFFLNAFEAQLAGSLVTTDGSVSNTQRYLNLLDLSFTMAFTFELLLNLYAHWFHEFAADGWSLFDLVVVAMSLLTLFSTQHTLPVTIFRLLRAFRVLRLFGRLKTIRSIINALTASLFPVLNAFCIMGVVLCLYAITGVNVFGEMAPESFGNLSRAVITMFRIAAGETWVDEIPIVWHATEGDVGQVDWAVGAFVMTFVLIVNWTLLQVTVAVLLDSFVGETAREREADTRRQLEAVRMQDTMGYMLDPLLKVITQEYIDEQHLSAFLRKLFVSFAADEGSQLDMQQTCRALGQLPTSPRLHFSVADYQTLTRHGELCNANGCLGIDEFETVMREQVYGYIQRKLQRTVRETETQEDFAHVAALKMLVGQFSQLGHNLCTAASREQHSAGGAVRGSGLECASGMARVDSTAAPVGKDWQEQMTCFGRELEGLRCEMTRLAAYAVDSHREIARLLNFFGLDTATAEYHHANAPEPTTPAQIPPMAAVLRAAHDTAANERRHQQGSYQASGGNGDAIGGNFIPCTPSPATEIKSGPREETRPYIEVSSPPVMQHVASSPAANETSPWEERQHSRSRSRSLPRHLTRMLRDSVSLSPLNITDELGRPNGTAARRASLPADKAARRQEEEETEELRQEQARLEDARRHSAAAAIREGSPMTFRTILKTSLPFREEWETLVEHGHECSQTDIGIERLRDTGQSDQLVKAAQARLRPSPYPVSGYRQSNDEMVC